MDTNIAAEPTPDACILNAGAGAWAFEGLAAQLAGGIGVPVAERPHRLNYLLFREADDLPPGCRSFIPLDGIRAASDKRVLADLFARRGVPTPETHLAESLAEALRIRAASPGREWCLKYPTACGAAGHRLLTEATVLPADWPTPLIVQEFVRLERPEVFRIYGAGGGTFGFVARRFPAGAKPSPWVAHARGARYEAEGDPPRGADEAARSALSAAGLLDSFGCVDLLRRPSGEWLVLEVGTDGLFNHVDRDLGIPSLEAEILRRVAATFRSWVAEAGRADAAETPVAG
jgi:glutathione synthase/RimK-type ligase-like ATP-grasp enzyme